MTGPKVFRVALDMPLRRVFDYLPPTSAPLIEPGTRDRCRLDRLSLVTACTTRFPELPVAVDGGVTEEIAPRCAAAGVRQMIVGRALMISERREAI